MRPTLCFLLFALPAIAGGSFFNFDFGFFQHADQHESHQLVEQLQEGNDSITVIPLKFPVSDIGKIIDKATNISKRIIALDTTIKELKARIQQVYDNKTTNVKDRLASVNSTTALIDALKTRIEHLQSQAAVVEDSLRTSNETLQCMGQTGCVTEPPEYTGPTTIAPPPSCDPSTGTELNVSASKQVSLKSYRYPKEFSNYGCAYTLRSEAGYSLSYSVEITGQGSWLNMTFGGSTTSYLPNTTISIVKTEVNFVQMETWADDESTISYYVTFNAYNPCSSYNCGQGTCYTDPDNKPACQCENCITLDANNNCTLDKNPCERYKRRCKGEEQCAANKTSPTCQAYCYIPVMSTLADLLTLP